jgi:hypothetical protein
MWQRAIAEYGMKGSVAAVLNRTLTSTGSIKNMEAGPAIVEEQAGEDL